MSATSQAGAVAWRAVATENGSSPQTLWIAMPVSSWAIHDEAAGICTIEYAYTTPPAAVPVEALEGLVRATEYLAGFEPLPQNRDDDPCVITISSGELRRFRKARDELTKLIKEHSNG